MKRFAGITIIAYYRGLYLPELPDGRRRQNARREAPDSESVTASRVKSVCCAQVGNGEEDGIFCHELESRTREARA